MKTTNQIYQQIIESAKQKLVMLINLAVFERSKFNTPTIKKLIANQISDLEILMKNEKLSPHQYDSIKTLLNEYQTSFKHRKTNK